MASNAEMKKLQHKKDSGVVQIYIVIETLNISFISVQNCIWDLSPPCGTDPYGLVWFPCSPVNKIMLMFSKVFAV